MSECNFLNVSSARYDVFDNTMLIIPKQLHQVILKMNPEIHSMRITDVISTLSYNPETLDPFENFRIKISIKIKPNERLKGNMTYYEDEIDKYFKYTYPNYGFVEFKVTEMIMIKPPSNRELFGRLFLPQE